MNLLETLAGTIGVRTAGSEQAARAADEIAEAFRELGLEPRFHEFPLLGYDAEEPVLEIDGERWTAGPCIYSHPGEVEGELRRIGDGIWAVGEGRLRRTPFGRGPIPFLTGLAYGGHIATAPTAFVSVADAERLEDGMRARLVVRGTFVPGRRERNVIAELPGANEEEAVVVGAHYDSVWRGPGAIDNATGVEGLRRVAERLLGREHPRSLRFIAFGAEEIGLIGARRYVLEEKEAERLDQIVGMVNLDCIGRGDQLQLLASPRELLGRCEELARTLGLRDRYEVSTEVGEEAGTDHLPFAQNKIPAVSVLHFPYDEYHLPVDTLELVDERLMDDAVDLATALVESQLAWPIPR
ncbi:MAG: M28 family metallopeptidase [Actinomycetota bacterium]|nr:M28 family metallopeptidase [Actinomycetota bacterium]